MSISVTSFALRYKHLVNNDKKQVIRVEIEHRKWLNTQYNKTK